ncbi:DsbE family thiol:disulfide interchange protein [Candidatus Thioglobus autotrophicus]|uniref:DsbE family thiol:disulfide interchange protein n=1 Tax=Candidatus Thioglobus autotrophicus TaxID=1705394 RepID=UPI00299DF0AC|nr:DsbE family thiol:disulfide interchange protein [Candidatus Thioglobus autotrophicus]WPE17048.1 DsbE family thiol:disulfide interchange protein [Candidatus Thioglobus autotrophicus]
MGKFLPLVVFVVLAWFLYDGLGRDTKKLPSPLIGKSFPDLEVEDFNTYKHYTTQSQLAGNITLVNVWASWCVTCRAEHQMLMEIAQSNNVKMLGINYKDTRKEGRFFLDRLGNPYEQIIFDEQGKLGLELGVYATPETFLVDSQGIIRFKRIGQLTPKIWKTKILPLIQQLKISAATNT